MVAFLLVGGLSLSYVAASMGVAHGIADALLKTSLSPIAIVLIYNLLLFVLGAPLETATIIVITMPLIFPALVVLGINPLWLGVMTAVNSEIGTICPPSGLVLFALKSLLPRDYTTRDLFTGVIPFIGVLSAFLLLIVAFPILSTWLPGTMR